MARVVLTDQASIRCFGPMAQLLGLKHVALPHVVVRPTRLGKPWRHDAEQSRSVRER
ncbi:hypothetical protein [Streptomyces sp. NPDC013455]|uniref:hypothetical protein n=1 Tax=Streptomyces sp. NPDC013455 TaxID=3155605 RepID=UPI0033D695B3